MDKLQTGLSASKQKKIGAIWTAHGGIRVGQDKWPFGSESNEDLTILAIRYDADEAVFLVKVGCGEMAIPGADVWRTDIEEV